MRGKVYIRTFGCQMNVKDSERMLGLLCEAGYGRADSVEEADVLLINTCAVRAKPEHKVASAVGRFKEYKDSRPGVVIGVGGCVAQRLGEAILSRSPWVDLVFGTQMVHCLPELIERAKAGERIVAVDWLDPGDQTLFRIPRGPCSDSVTAFVSIMQGCNNYCAYCVVPYVRGPEVSRASSDILAEIETLCGSGVKEVTLLGQNVNSYRDGKLGFADLLEMVADRDGLNRVRFITSHPKDLGGRLIEIMASHPNVMEAIHLPVQAGSNRILELMNRGYTRERYLGLVSRLRDAMPGVGLTTDLIVGFPGEREGDFLETLELLREVQYDETFSFRYSSRPGTRAVGLPDQVDESEKYERLYRLQDLQREITERKNQLEVGQVREVLVEGPSKTNPERMSGRSRANRLVHFPNREVRPGELVMVQITRALKHSLEGVYISRVTDINRINEEVSCQLK